MAKKLPFIFEDLRQMLRGKGTQSWGETAGTAYTSTLESLKGLGGDTLGKTAANFNEALPYIERAGYDVTEVEVGLGLSPRISPHLRLRELLSEEEQNALLAETAGRKLIHAILSSLFKANAARRKLNFKRFHFSDIELEISILPTVILKFRPDTNSKEVLPVVPDLTENTPPE